MSDIKICQFCGEEIKSIAIKCKHCGSMLNEAQMTIRAVEPDMAVKNALHESYTIYDEIGRGGMATVYRAQQKSLKREVALKILPGQFTHDDEFIKRFHQEARSAASLNHPNIVTIYDEGTISGVHFISMALISGEDLNSRINRNGPISEKEVLSYITPIADGLTYAHEKGMVHRDIKTANILLDENSTPYLTDFGIAHAGDGSKLTRTGTLLGTPEYMSPEQAKGELTDCRSDIYSLGIVMYECITGQRPFTGETLLGVVHKIASEEPKPISEFIPDISDKLNRIIMKCLEKNPSDRFQSCHELICAIDSGVFEVVPKKEKKKKTPHKPKSKKIILIVLISFILSFTGYRVYDYITYYDAELETLDYMLDYLEDDSNISDDLTQDRLRRPPLGEMPPDRRFKEPPMEGLNPTGGTLSIFSNPPDSDIYLNGEYIGITPINDFTLDIGEYDLTIKAENHLVYTQKIVIELHQLTTINKFMEKAMGNIKIDSNPPGATIFIDGVLLGITPLNLNDIRPGKQRITLRLTGFEELKESIEVMQGESDNYKFILTKITEKNNILPPPK